MSARNLSLVFAVMCAFVGSVAFAESPVGVWRTIDDKTKTERSIVRIVEVGGELRGTVEQIFTRPDEDPQHLCDKCSGERKDQPIIGMAILWGLKNNDGAWSGGQILDPKNGKIYRCKMTLSEDGRSLDVRGYIGFSLIGRTQTWHRVE
jgi:uncharacterized protein (DUF2147 family)